MANTQDPYSATRKAFQEGLNQHGYPFQHAVVHRIREMYGSEGSLWQVVATEVPVDVGTGTRIDIVMAMEKTLVTTIVIGECKRVNTAYSAWCFIPSPFTHADRQRKHERLSLDCLSYKLRDQHDIRVRIEQRDAFYLDPAYSIGLAIKQGQSGDPQPARGSSHDAIEDAATQVMRGANGLINALATHPQMLLNDRLNALLPVIFTTAKLFVSNANLAQSSLLDGTVDLASDSFAEVPWLWYQYHSSPGLRHSQRIDRSSITSFANLMDTYYVRTIAIVGYNGLDAFLRWTTDRDLGLGR